MEKKTVKRIKGKRKFSAFPKDGTPFVVCIECGKKKELEYACNMSDLEAATVLWKLGWSILPTYCPKHSKIKRKS